MRVPKNRITFPPVVLSLVFGCLDTADVLCRCHLVCKSWRVRAAWSVLDARAFVLARRSWGWGFQLLFALLFAACVPSQVRRFVAHSYCGEMLTAFENLEHCELHCANMGDYKTPLAFSRRLQSLSLTGCMFAKGSTPLAGLETTKLRLYKHSRRDIQDCCLAVNNGISELEIVIIGDVEARQVSEMHTVTSLCCTTAHLSAEGFAELFKLPLLRKLRLVCPRLGAFQAIPENQNLVETLELVYNDNEGVEVQGVEVRNVAPFVARFPKLRSLGLFLHPSWKRCQDIINERVRDAIRPEIEITLAFES
jgi:hypothetical protein